MPGSDWLYFKIYTGIKTADEIVPQTLYPYLRKLYDDKAIDNYFFIRYTDPEFHIRFRVHVPKIESYAVIFQNFHSMFQPLLENGSVLKVLCDTYVREIERYGAATMELLEELFCVDSRAVMELLAGISDLPAQNRETVRWQLALVLLDDALTAFGRDLPEKEKLVSQMADRFKQEFGFTSHPFTKQINDKYRQFRKEIEKGLSTREVFAAQESILQKRRSDIEEIADKIRAIKTSDPNPPTVEDLLFSTSHMTMNRWFRANNRQHELVIYDFLSKYYESARARAKKSTNETPDGNN